MRVKTLPLLALTAMVCAIPVHAETLEKAAKSAPDSTQSAPTANSAETSTGVSGEAAKKPKLVVASTADADASAAETKPVTQAAVAKPKPKPVAATLRVSINLTAQTMTVTANGTTQGVWKISSGRSGYRTPTGNYRPQWMSRMHYSKKYDNAPMPHSVFFHRGYAIHATYATSRLGGPASHGCIRLSPSHAKRFYRLVQKHGKSATRIAIHGVATDRRYIAKKKSSRRRARLARSTYGYQNPWALQSSYKHKPRRVRHYQAKKKVWAAKPYKKPLKKTYKKYAATPTYTWPGD